jgi:hypothetical protein
MLDLDPSDGQHDLARAKNSSTANKETRGDKRKESSE